MFLNSTESKTEHTRKKINFQALSSVRLDLTRVTLQG